MIIVCSTIPFSIVKNNYICLSSRLYMKKTLLLISGLAVAAIADAQSFTVSGSVKDSKGNGVPLAMVQDKKSNTATRTDSVGKFTLQSDANSRITVISAGYAAKTVDVNGNTNLLVVLSDKKAGDDDTKTPSAFNDYTGYNGASTSLLYSSNSTSGLLPTFHPTEATQGSKYLDNDWLSGSIVGSDGSLIKNPQYGLNYDKITGGLLLSQDRKTAIEVDKDKVKSFTIVDKNDVENTFVSVPEIDKSHYVVLLSDGSKYKIYKQIATKFIKNNYHTDGMTSSGNNYDEYEDTYTYYVLNAKTSKLQVITTRKKSLKAAFEADGVKMDNFFAQNNDNSNADAYLKQLGAYVNQ